jgi:hypothetical protein
MKRCDHCGGRFGLVRHRNYTFCFCSENCLEAWQRCQREKALRRCLEGQGQAIDVAVGGGSRYAQLWNAKNAASTRQPNAAAWFQRTASPR